MNKLIHSITPHDIIGWHKIRLGCHRDGGYVVMREPLSTVKHVVLCGVGNDISFCDDALRIVPTCDLHAYDGTVDSLPSNKMDMSRVTFIKQNVTSIDQVIKGLDDVLLSIDIEGGEYTAFWGDDGSFADLSNVSQLVIELHDIMGSRHFDAIRLVDAISAKMRLVHVHGNNFGGVNRAWGSLIPNVIELTFVNKALIPDGSSQRTRSVYPIRGLDFPNKPESPDLVLPFINTFDSRDQILVMAGPDSPRLGIIAGLEGIRRNYPDYNVCVVSPRNVLYDLCGFREFTLIDENNILRSDTIKDMWCRAHPSACGMWKWYYQQFLKYKFVQTPYCTGHDYTVIDGDTVVLKRIEFKRNGKYLFNRKWEHHDPYFRTISNLFPGIDCSVSNGDRPSFISEYMPFSYDILNDMLNRLGGDWVSRIITAIDQRDAGNFGFSEYETYGTYMRNYYSELFENLALVTWRDGAERYDGTVPPYDTLVTECASADTISFERGGFWHVNRDKIV